MPVLGRGKAKKVGDVVDRGKVIFAAESVMSRFIRQVLGTEVNGLEKGVQT